MKIKSLSGIILYSPDPVRLARFYIEKIGMPFELQIHGNIREHYECIFNNIHFAILKKGKETTERNFIPSFRVENINAYLDYHHLKTIHPVVDLGEGKKVVTIKDADENPVRLIQIS
jgi:hypothetical protein